MTPRSDGLSFADVHEYLARNCEFERCIRTNRPLSQTFAGLNIVEMVVFPPCDVSVVYVPVPDWWIGWEPICLILAQSPSFFTSYSGLVLCEF